VAAFRAAVSALDLDRLESLKSLPAAPAAPAKR
jgi:hypothetical protein